MPGKDILERVFEVARRLYAQTSERGKAAAAGAWSGEYPLMRGRWAHDLSGMEPVGLIALFHRSRNALITHAFGRRPASNSEIRSAFALVAMRNDARPGVVVA